MRNIIIENNTTTEIKFIGFIFNFHQNEIGRINLDVAYLFFYFNIPYTYRTENVCTGLKRCLVHI